jgi:sugar lactone lactonase YvrE
MLPEVGKAHKLTDDPNLRGISGSSSGGIAAFTAAWNRPDAFRRVLSFIGSYTDLRGGNVYPALIRKTEPKPLRVFLQDGENDLDIYSGSWWIANLDMAAALAYSRYDFKFVNGTEAHNNVHGRAILPDALRWLWRDWEAPVKASKTGGDRQYVMDFLDPASDWEQVSSGHEFTEGPAIAPNGDVYFTDTRGSKIWKIGADDKVSLFKDHTENTNGLMFGPDGLLYGCQGGGNKLISFTTSGEQKTVAEVSGCNDLVVTAAGNIYYTDPANHQVWYLPKGGQPKVVHEGADRADRAARGTVRPNGVVISPDQSLLFVADSWSKWTWSFQIQPDGSLANEQAVYRLEASDASSATSADGMAVAADGHLYVATSVGLQVCDQPGRVVGIINKPQAGALSNAVFAGADLKTLYVTAGDKVFRRRMRVAGFYPWKAVTPPRPRL